MALDKEDEEGEVEEREKTEKKRRKKKRRRRKRRRRRRSYMYYDYGKRYFQRAFSLSFFNFLEISNRDTLKMSKE